VMRLAARSVTMTGSLMSILGLGPGLRKAALSP
jgi:hypothetical protein